MVLLSHGAMGVHYLPTRRLTHDRYSKSNAARLAVASH